MSETLQQPQQNKGGGRISLLALVMVLYIAHKAMPVVGYYTPAVVRAGMCGLLLMMLMPLFRRRETWTLFGMFMISLLDIINRAANGNEMLLYIYGEVQTLVYGLIALRFTAKGDKKASRNMFLFILIMYLLTAVTTIIGNGRYPQASRWMATFSNTNAAYAVYTKNNIGGFSFAYELVLLTPILVYMIKQRVMKPILGYGILILIAVCMVYMEYGMALILFAVAVSLLVLPKLSTKRMMRLLAIALVLFLAFGEMVATLFEVLSENIDSRTLSQRFLVASQVLRGEGEINGAVGGNRLEAYNTSVQAILKTGFMGGWGNAITGGHSLLLDTLGQYGLVGLAALIVMYVSVYRVALKPYKKELFYPYMLATYLLAIVMMVMNPKSFLFVFMVVLPLFGQWQKSEAREK